MNEIMILKSEPYPIKPHCISYVMKWNKTNDMFIFTLTLSHALLPSKTQLRHVIIKKYPDIKENRNH